MNKDFVNYEQAKALKDLGFDEDCFGYYAPEMDGKYYIFSITRDDIGSANSEINNPNSCTAPLWQQAFRFFRDKYGLHAHFFSKENETFVWCIRWYIDGNQQDIPYCSAVTYEEAELACLIKLIEIVKEENK